MIGGSTVSEELSRKDESKRQRPTKKTKLDKKLVNVTLLTLTLSFISLIVVD